MFLLDLSGYRSFSSDMAGDSSGRKGTDRSPARLIDRMAVAPFEAAIAMARSRTAVQGRLRSEDRGRVGARPSHTARHGKTPVRGSCATDRRSHIPRDRHHHLSEKRRHAPERTSMANHAPTRSTQLYGRRRDYISLNEVEQI